MRRSTVAAIVPAAGQGKRMSGEQNKIWMELGSKPIISHALQVLEGCSHVGRIVLVVSGDEMARARHFLEEQCFEKTMVIEGGLTRRDSVYSGLLALEAFDWIVVHDGARPLVTPDLLERVIEAAFQHGAAISAVPLTDTLKRADDDGIARETLPRESLYYAQTPQAFGRDLLLRAHQTCRGTATDDASLVERLGHPVRIVTGSSENLKITYPGDLCLAKAVLSLRKSKGGESMIRVGTGYDVHRLVPNRKLVLGGIEVPHEMGVEAHSDGDVLIHAVIDALLGAAGEGDIGRHFPPTEEYRGANSLDLLKRVVYIIKEKGWLPLNVDATIIAETPRLSPYIPEMERCLTGILKAPVSVKATTNEGVGAVGRQEALAAMAVALICPE